MAIRIRKLGHSHKLTVPTQRKGIGVAQAAQQVARNKATITHPGASYGPYDEPGDIMKSGGTIHINPKNKGKFNALKHRTGKSTSELTHSKNPLTRKRAIFAQNARKWHHKHEDGGFTTSGDYINALLAEGGFINPIDPTQMFMSGGEVAAARKRPGGSNVGKKTFANGKKRTGPYAGPSGGAPKGSYPIPDIGHARAALRLAHHAPNPAGIKAKVYRKYPQLKHEEGGWIEEYGQGGRTINPAMGGYEIGGRYAYPPTAPYPPEYGFGGVLQSFAPFVSMIPGYGTAIGAAMNMAGGALEKQSQQKDQENELIQKKVQAEQSAQASITGNYRPTFAWGGRTPETRSFSPSGLTMGHVPGYDSNSNYANTVPGKGFNYRMVRGRNEGVNWQRDTNMNVHRHTYAIGGPIDPNMAPVELEKQEVFQTPTGQMGQVNGPSHAEGGVDMELPENSFVWSDKLKTAKGTTFADEAARLGRLKAKYEKILRA